MVVGIDEVGRGCLAGPVVVGLVVLDGDIMNTWQEVTGLSVIKDSKKLSHNKRAQIKSALISYDGVIWTTGEASAAEVDNIGIVPATSLAVKRALEKINNLNFDTIIRIDAGIKINTKYTCESHIKGDEKFPEIALASILAKETRDDYMKEMAIKYSGYGFEKHVGYGTQKHLQAITDLGLTPLHRKSFIR